MNVVPHAKQNQDTNDAIGLLRRRWASNGGVLVVSRGGLNDERAEFGISPVEGSCEFPTVLVIHTVKVENRPVIRFQWKAKVQSLG